MAIHREDQSSLPSLSIIEHPRCSKCSTRMAIGGVDPAPSGYEYRSFECQRCGETKRIMLLIDPMDSDGLGWTAGHLHAPK